MFNLGGKREKDPKKALENADKAVNKGLSGALVKGFMGKDFVNDVNSALDQGKQECQAPLLQAHQHRRILKAFRVRH